MIEFYRFSENISFQPDNLWKYLQKYVDTKKLQWPYNVKEIMDSWLNLEHYPEVYVRSNFNDNTTTFSTNDVSNSCIIPITFISQTNLILGRAWSVIWLECKKNKNIFMTAEHGFIIANFEQSGEDQLRNSLRATFILYYLIRCCATFFRFI